MNVDPELKSAFLLALVLFIYAYAIKLHSEHLQRIMRGEENGSVQTD